MHREPAEISVALEELTRLLLRRMTPDSGLSLTAAATLARLDRAGPGRLTELAAGEGVTQPAMSQLVNRLQELGLAERLPDPDDGRVVVVHITDAGRAQLAHRRAVRADRLAALLDRLDDADRRALDAALPAITALTRLAAGTSAPAPAPERSPS